MIPPDRHTREWIIAQQARLGMADPIILEKAIFALTLLDLLGRTDLDFVFKGGTALLLHLPRPNRLSIDIDIVCNAPKADFESALDALLPQSPFLRWNEQARGERGLPGRRHYRFHFQSPTQGQEMHILLDVVTEPNVLIHIVERPVNTAFLQSLSPRHCPTGQPSGFRFISPSRSQNRRRQSRAARHAPQSLGPFKFSPGFCPRFSRQASGSSTGRTFYLSQPPQNFLPGGVLLLDLT